MDDLNDFPTEEVHLDLSELALGHVLVAELTTDCDGADAGRGEAPSQRRGIRWVVDSETVDWIDLGR